MYGPNNEYIFNLITMYLWVVCTLYIVYKRGRRFPPHYTSSTVGGADFRATILRVQQRGRLLCHYRSDLILTYTHLAESYTTRSSKRTIHPSHLNTVTTLIIIICKNFIVNMITCYKVSVLCSSTIIYYLKKLIKFTFNWFDARLDISKFIFTHTLTIPE